MAEFYRNIYPHVKEVNQICDHMQQIILFDTETTGLEEDAKIIQFSAVLYEKGLDGSFIEKDNLDIYINPLEPISPVIEELTGITNEQLALAMPEDQVVSRIITFMNQADTWGAYNASFDLLKLKHMAARTNTPYIEHQCIDVLIMARNMIRKDTIKNHKLGTVTERLCPTYEAKFHNSLEDVRATGKILEQLNKMYHEVKTPTERPEKLVISGAKFWINPHMQNMRRLKIYSNNVDTGIFWNCNKGGWSCKADTKLQKYFRTLDIANIEEQVIRMYYPKYQTTSMDDLTREWGHDYYEKHKSYLTNQLKQQKSIKQTKSKKQVVEPELDIELD